MSRTDEAYALLAQSAAQDWSAAELSVRLNCAPSQARAALEVLMERGQAVCSPAGRYIWADVRGDILRLLQHGHEHELEYTPLAVAEALTWLHLDEAQATRHLCAMAQAGQIEAWFSLPGGTVPA